jgi:hypothetical protein
VFSKSVLVAAAICAAALFLIAPSANAVTSQTLYAAQGNNNASALYTVDPTTGVATSVAPIGMAITGLAYNATTSTLYGVTTPNSPVSPQSLVTIDTTTGTPTVIGPLAVPAGSSQTIAEIEFDGSGNLWGWSESGDHLVEIDTATGALTDFPNFISTAGDGMTWDPAINTMWIMPNGIGGNYYSLNLATGEPTLVGTLSGSSFGGQVSAAGQSCDGNTTFGIAQGNPSGLITVNYSTGVVTDVGSTTVNTIDGLAVACPPPVTPVTPPAPAAAAPVLSGVGHGTVKRCTPVAGKCRVPIKFTLNATATVTLKITRQYGRKTKKRCNTVNPEIRNQPVCTLNTPTYTKKLSGKVGANAYTFKMPRTATLGHYKFTVAAKFANGSTKTTPSRFILPWG